MTTKVTIEEWFDRGVEREADYMIIVCDNFEYEDYPVFVSTEDFYTKYNEYNNKNMQTIMEVYDLKGDKLRQLHEPRSRHLPPK